MASKYDELNERVERMEKRPTPPPFNRMEHNDKTRSRIANVFTFGYLGIVTLILIGAPVYNIFAQQSIDIKSTLITISSVVGTPFGFIIGYYFKGSDKER